jgi:hypothetical protein
MHRFLPLLVLAGCASPTAAPRAPAPDAPPVAATPAPPPAAKPERCDEYQAMFRKMGTEDIRAHDDADQEYCHFENLPVSTVWQPIKQDGSFFGAYELPQPSYRTVHRSGPPPKIVYVAASPELKLGELRQLRATLSGRPEVRLVVWKPPAHKAATHLLDFPHTPRWLADELSARTRYFGMEEDLPRAVELGKPCYAALRAFRLMGAGGGIDVVGPALADGLAACSCQMNDLDGFVSLTAYAMLPTRDCGYLPLDDKILAGFGDEATAGDLAAALAKQP